MPLLIQNLISRREHKTIMNIPSLGLLQAHSAIPKWLISTPINVPYFNGRKLSFTLADLSDSDSRDVQDAVDVFLALDSKARLAASSYVFKNYKDFVDVMGDDAVECQPATPEHIWEHVHPTEILVSRRHRHDKAIYVQIAAECDWEPEHGLQIIYRRGNALSRVSAQDGHLTHSDACGLPEDQDKIV